MTLTRGAVTSFLSEIGRSVTSVSMWNVGKISYCRRIQSVIKSRLFC